MLRRFSLCGCTFAFSFALAFGQAPTVEKQAEQLLDTAQKAYNDGNPQAATGQFAEFLQKFNGQKGTSAAKFGLGLALLDLSERDYQKAADAFAGPAEEATFSDRPLALYYLAVCHRGLGLKELAEALKNPAEAERRKGAIEAKFNTAERYFGRAVEAFDQRKAQGDGEWAARSRCDKAEMALRLNKPKEARASVEPFVNDPALAGSKSRPLGLYYHGFACFQLNDLPAAGKSLGLAAPFEQPFGPHARYLLGRVFQSGGENAEAAAAFDAVIAGYDKQKKDALERLKQPDQFKSDPWEKARLEAIVKDAPPDYVAGANFYGACLHYEGGKFAEALAKFQMFAKDYAASPFAADALLRVGFCLVQLKQFDEAVKVLKPLAGQQRRLSDQALFWLGKAQLGQAQAVEANNKPAREQAVKAALATLRMAADRSAELASQEPAAADRRIDMMLEIADALSAAHQPREAAEAYLAVWKAKPTGARSEEALQRVVSAHQIAEDFSNTSYWAGIFKQKYPQSPLLAEVLFREASALHGRARNLANKKDALAKDVYPKALAAYETLVKKYPEYERVNRARYGLAVAQAELGEWEKAVATLETIPAQDRVGDAAAASFLLADSLIRTAPAVAEDALADNMLREKLGTAIGLLEAFVAANPKAPEAPEALLKLGYAYKRLGIQLADPKEKNDAFAKARAAFDRVQKDYAATPALAQALLERAKLRLLQGDKAGAFAELRAFTQDPLKLDPLAPLAVISYATLLREQNQAPLAVAALKEARERYEPALTADPQRVEWLHLLRYHHGLALLEAGQIPEARQTFEMVAGSRLGKPIGAEAVLMAEKTVATDLRKKLDDALKARQQPNLKQEQIEEAERKIKAARRELVEHGKHMERRADGLKNSQPTHEARAQLHYDAAWLYRFLSPLAPLNPNGRPATEADKDGKDPFPKEMLDLTRAAYSRVISDFPDAAIGVEARFELAEIESDTGNADVAVKLLADALDKEPADRPTPVELTERIRLRLGVAYFDRKEYDAAKGQFDIIAQHAKSPLRGQAAYRVAECLFALNKIEEAKNALKPFRDDAALQQVPNVSDRALLRLGHAYAATKNWESSRQAFETMLGRYGNSPWAADARYGMGWAYLNLNRHEEAVNQFTQVTTLKTDELAGRAHLQIGLCRAAQKKYGEAVKAFMTVAYGYDAPDLRFTAMLEAARVLGEEKKTAEAVKLLEKVIQDSPADSEWSKAAKERLAKGK